MPRIVCGHRRGLAVIDRAKFDQWLENVPRIVFVELPEQPERTPSELCHQFLQDLVDSDTPWRPKLEIRKEAIRKISDLSARRFDQIWASAAPDHWKKSGRRAKLQ